MDREIKFRIVHKNKIVGYEHLTENGWMWNWIELNPNKGERWSHGVIQDSTPKAMTRNQFTGLKDKNGKEIYEGDIFRIEENGEIEDNILYVVVVWVNEWSMFATLLDYEYHDYVENGVKALDEQLFWAYNIDDTDSHKHFLCGNIYENPELLNNG